MEKNLQKNRLKISCRIATPSGNSSHITSVCLFVKEQCPSPPFPAACGVILYTIHLFSKRDSDAVCAYFSVFLPISTLHHCLFSVNIFRMKTIFSTFLLSDNISLYYTIKNVSFSVLCLLLETLTFLFCICIFYEINFRNKRTSLSIFCPGGSPFFPYRLFFHTKKRASIRMLP